MNALETKAFELLKPVLKVEGGREIVVKQLALADEVTEEQAKEAVAEAFAEWLDIYYE